MINLAHSSFPKDVHLEEGVGVNIEATVIEKELRALRELDTNLNRILNGFSGLEQNYQKSLETSDNPKDHKRATDAEVVALISRISADYLPHRYPTLEVSDKDRTMLQHILILASESENLPDYDFSKWSNKVTTPYFFKTIRNIVRNLKHINQAGLKELTKKN